MKKLIILLAMLLTACTAFVTKPEVTLKDVKLVGLDSNGVDLDFYLTINNPNSFDMKMTGYNYDVKIMALPLAKGTSREIYDFHAKSATDVLIPVKISYNDLMEVIKRRPNPDSIPYQLHADLAIDTKLGNMAIPVNKTGTVAIPKEYRPSKIWKKVGDFLKGMEKQK